MHIHYVCTAHCTEVRFGSFLSGGFITEVVVNSLERKLAKRTSLHCTEVRFASFESGGFITAKLVNPPDWKRVNCTSVHCTILCKFLEFSMSVFFNKNMPLIYQDVNVNINITKRMFAVKRALLTIIMRTHLPSLHR